MWVLRWEMAGPFSIWSFFHWCKPRHLVPSPGGALAFARTYNVSWIPAPEQSESFGAIYVYEVYTSFVNFYGVWGHQDIKIFIYLQTYAPAEHTRIYHPQTFENLNIQAHKFTDVQRWKNTNVRTCRHTGTQTVWRANVQTYIAQTYKYTNIQPRRDRNKTTYKYANMQSCKQTGRQTDR